MPDREALTRESAFAWVLVKDDAELAMRVQRDRVIVSVGVPHGWMSEEPERAITLKVHEALQAADALRAAADMVGARHG